MNWFKAFTVLMFTCLSCGVIAESFSCSSGQPSCVQYGDGIYSNSGITRLENQFDTLQSEYNELAREYNDLLAAANRAREEQNETYEDLYRQAKVVESERDEWRSEYSSLLKQAKQIESNYNACISR